MTESTGKRKSKRQYWQQVVSDWEQSDIKTQKEFCRQLGISTKSLSRWRRVFASDQQPPQQVVGFAQVKIGVQKTSDTTIRIGLHGSTYIDVPAGFDEVTLRRVLSVLR